MKLSRFTPCNKFEIRTPVWGGRKVGLATYKVGTHNQVDISFTNSSGERIYPNSFYVSGEKIKKYPIEPVKSNPSVKLYIIPINDLEPLERV